MASWIDIINNQYIVGADYAIDGGNELITFCVMRRDNDTFVIEDCGVVKKQFKTHSESSFTKYCKFLASKYNVDNIINLINKKTNGI